MMDAYVAKSQFWLSMLFLSGYFAVLILFMLGYSDIPEALRDVFSSLVSLQTAGGLAIIYFWFQRQRGSQSNA